VVRGAAAEQLTTASTYVRPAVARQVRQDGMLPRSDQIEAGLTTTALTAPFSYQSPILFPLRFIEWFSPGRWRRLF
jgi:hypothetical protein